MHCAVEPWPHFTTFAKCFPSARAQSRIHYILLNTGSGLKCFCWGCQGRPTKDEDLFLWRVCLRYDSRLCSPISMKATVVRGAALSSSHFIWPPLRQVNRLYSPDGHILAGGDSGTSAFHFYLFHFFIDFFCFFSHQPFGLRRPVLPAAAALSSRLNAV